MDRPRLRRLRDGEGRPLPAAEQALLDLGDSAETARVERLLIGAADPALAAPPAAPTPADADPARCD